MPNDTSTLLLPSEKKKKREKQIYIYFFKKKRREEKKKTSLGTIVPVQFKHVPIQLAKKQAVAKLYRYNLNLYRYNLFKKWQWRSCTGTT